MKAKDVRGALQFKFVKSKQYLVKNDFLTKPGVTSYCLKALLLLLEGCIKILWQERQWSDEGIVRKARHNVCTTNNSVLFPCCQEKADAGHEGLHRR